MDIRPPTEIEQSAAAGLTRYRSPAIQVAVFPAGGLLIIGLIGLIANPSNTGAQIILWALVLGSAGVLLGAVFLVRGVPGELQREYKRNLDEATERFKQLSARDWITGLLTPVEFQGAVKMEISRSQRYDRDAAVAVIEPDPRTIEQIKNREGALDAVAQYLATGLSAALRDTDVLGRNGMGFGVVALLPETNADGAGIAGDRILSSFEDRTVKLPDEEQVSLVVSVAVATFPNDGEEAEALVERARQRASWVDNYIRPI